MNKKLLLYPLLLVTGLAFAGTAVTWNGSSYTVPSVGEENWFGADKVDGLLIDLATHGFQKTGGAFTLSSEVDFGGSAGLTGLYFGTRSSNDSTAGVFRLANAESIGWRNGANGANLLLSVNSSNSLTFNGAVIADSSGIVPVTSGGTGLITYATGDVLYASSSSALSRLAIGTSDYLLKSNGTTPSWGQVVNASVDNSAAIARSKLASGTADHVVINSGAGAFSSEAQLAVSRGGTNISSYTTGDLLYASGAGTLAKLGIGSANNVLKVSGGLPVWDSPSTAVNVTALKTSDYTASSTDDLILVSPTTGTVIISLPAASANSGKVYHVERPAINHQIARISASSGDTIDGSTTFLMGTFGDSVSIASDGGTTWRVINDNTKVFVLAQNNAGGAVDTSTNIDWSTENVDTHGAWSGSVFTAPKSGIYVFSGYYRTTTNIAEQTALYIDGVTTNIISPDAAANAFHIIKFSYYLNKGQTASMRGGSGTLQNGAGDNWLSIYSQK